MKKKICGIILCCIVIMAVGLFLINKPTDTTHAVQTVAVSMKAKPTAAPTVEPTATPEPTVEPTTEPPVDNIVVEEAEVPEELQSELEGREITEVVPEKTSIVEVEEATPEPTEAPKVEEPVVEATPTPAVAEPKAEEPTPAPQTGNNGAPAGLSPEAQALYDQMIAAGGKNADDIVLTHQESVATGHTGNVWQ